MAKPTTPFWLTEQELPFGKPGVKLSVQVTQVLHDETSPYGHIQVVNTPFYGRMLVIDGIIQTTESDEFIYHEMMVQLPGLQVGAPRTMLIVGGGDGGALRQALRFNSLRQVVQVEIDDLVTRVSQQYLPAISGGAFTNPRVQLVYADGATYVKDSQDLFDVIILDLTDPMPNGPAAALFDEPFLTDVKARLAPGGVVMMQCGSLLFQPDEVKDQVKRLKRVFGHARLHTAVVPGYQLTTFGFALASASQLAELTPAQVVQRQADIAGNNQYLSPQMYQASMALPPYLRAELNIV